MKQFQITIIKTCIFLFGVLVGQHVTAQTTNDKVPDYSNFYLFYGIRGLGSNFNRLYPTLRVYENKFTYTKEQSKGSDKQSQSKKFIRKGILKQSSIDSMLSIIKGLEDSTIYKTNLCILSGAIINIVIAKGTDTTTFILHNTFDITALQLVKILNPYLPADKKLHGSAKDIFERDECLKNLKNQTKGKDSSILKQ